MTDLAFTIDRVGMESLPVIKSLNRALFGEERLINRLDRPDMLMFLASVSGRPVGFKIGYALDSRTYYSAKGGVHPEFRRNGIARALLVRMMNVVREQGFEVFRFDTFPNIHPGMIVLGLENGFRVVGADFNPAYADFRIRLERSLMDFDESTGK